MKLQLPPRGDGRRMSVTSRRLTIIGANGAGKSRFAASMAALAGDRAFSMSVLAAIYSDREDPSPGSVDSLYHEAVARSPLIREGIRGGFERLTALLVNETALELLAERLAGDRIDGRPTRLQRLFDNWQAIFPGNTMLLVCGRLLIDGADGNSYPANRLSAGEKAVLYSLGAALVAPQGAVIFVDAPEMFLHQSVIGPLWDRVERLRPDCTFVYTTHDLGFAASRASGDILWVKSCDPGAGTWEYELLPEAAGIPEDVYMAILGERKPVLFIEGDARHSYDSRLYPLVFPEFTVKPLGSCDRVIEATRSFNSLRGFHDLDARGIVDRDRRADNEVEYLRGRRILVPDVAEIENMFMLEAVVRTVAAANGRDPQAAFGRVRKNLLSLFRGNIERQALEHTRHRIKHEVTRRVDGRFDGIEALERHISELMLTVNPRGVYEGILGQFRGYLDGGDYASVLKVFNHKSMLAETHVSEITGAGGDDKRRYIETVLEMLRQTDTAEAYAIRSSIRGAFRLEPERQTSRKG